MKGQTVVVYQVTDGQIDRQGWDRAAGRQGRQIADEKEGF